MFQDPKIVPEPSREEILDMLSDAGYPESFLKRPGVDISLNAGARGDSHIFVPTASVKIAIPFDVAPHLRKAVRGPATNTNHFLKGVAEVNDFPADLFTFKGTPGTSKGTLSLTLPLSDLMEAGGGPVAQAGHHFLLSLKLSTPAIRMLEPACQGNSFADASVTDEKDPRAKSDLLANLAHDWRDLCRLFHALDNGCTRKDINPDVNTQPDIRELHYPEGKLDLYFDPCPRISSEPRQQPKWFQLFCGEIERAGGTLSWIPQALGPATFTVSCDKQHEPMVFELLDFYAQFIDVAKLGSSRF